MLYGFFIGATHLDHCPVQPHIPIYLIVLGASSILSLIFTYSTNVDGAVYVLSSACMTVLHIFCFAWLIAGTTKKKKKFWSFTWILQGILCISRHPEVWYFLYSSPRHYLGLCGLSSKLLWNRSILRQDDLPVCFCYHHTDVGCCVLLVHLWVLLHSSDLLLHNYSCKTSLDTQSQHILWCNK